MNGERSRWAEVRTAAPDTHLCLSLVHGEIASRSEALRGAFAALEAGADSVYCSLSPRFIEALAREGVPVCAHAGLVPQKARMTGMRGFGKTAAEAQAVFAAVKGFEAAGAAMVELECLAAPVTALITARTSLTTVSIGSGRGADVQYLFGCDILGEPGIGRATPAPLTTSPPRTRAFRPAASRPLPPTATPCWRKAIRQRRKR